MADKKKESEPKEKITSEYKLENVQCISCLETLKIVRNQINIRFGFNGLGKSSIGKGLEAFINNNEKKKEALVPFGTKKVPLVEAINGTKPFDKCYIFNSEFVDNSLFQKDNVSKDTPSIFIYTDEVNKHIDSIKTQASNITAYLKDESNPLNVYAGFDDYTANFVGDNHDQIKDKTDLKKGIQFGANIKHFTASYIFDTFKDFMEMDDHAQWYKWRQQANPEWTDIGKCPYCGKPLSDQEIEELDKINEGFKPDEDSKPNSDKYVQAINIINTMKKYAKTDDEIKTFDDFLSSGDLGSKELIHKIYLVNDNAQKEIRKIKELRELSSIFTEEKINTAALDERIKSLKLDVSSYEKFDGKGAEPNKYVEAANNVNALIDNLLGEYPDLQKEVKNVNDEIEKNIKENNDKINTFLSLSGIPYKFDIELNKKEYKSVLRPINTDKSKLKAEDIKNHLSFGEHNSLSMALFATMYKSKDDNALIILDDPISSFDNNKKYAVLHFLFNQTDGLLKDKTVLMLTHDQEPVVDLFLKPIVKGVDSNINASFLSKTFDNVIKENDIDKNKFVSSYNYELKCIEDTSKHMYLRLFHLKRSLEILREETSAYAYVCSLLKFYNKPTISEDSKDEMKPKDVKSAEQIVKERVKGFISYDKFLKDFGNLDVLCALYEDTKNKDSVENIGVLRTLMNYFNYLNKGKCEKIKADDVLMHFFNESYHPENDNLFILEGYCDIPPYILQGAETIYQSIKELVDSGKAIKAK